MCGGQGEEEAARLPLPVVTLPSTEILHPQHQKLTLSKSAASACLSDLTEWTEDTWPSAFRLLGSKIVLCRTHCYMYSPFSNICGLSN